MSVLIAPKPFGEFTPDEYHAYVSAMWALRVKRGTKPAGPAPGLSVTRTKKGALTVRRQPKQRAFDYVTMPEIAGLARAHSTNQADLWNMFKGREYIIARDRMEAEQIYANIKEIPWGND